MVFETLAPNKLWSVYSVVRDVLVDIYHASFVRQLIAITEEITQKDS